MRFNSSAGRSNWCLYVHGLNILLPTCSQQDKRKKKALPRCWRGKAETLLITFKFCIPPWEDKNLQSNRKKILQLNDSSIKSLFLPKERVALLESVVLRYTQLLSMESLDPTLAAELSSEGLDILKASSMQKFTSFLHTQTFLYLKCRYWKDIWEEKWSWAVVVRTAPSL